MTDEASRIVVLGDVAYCVTDFNRRTVLQDHYLQKWVRKIGADKILPEAEEASSAFVARLASIIVGSGLGANLVAGLLLPEGVPQVGWSPALAAQTAAKIQALNSPEDRESVETLNLEISFNYFREALEKLARVQGYESMAERSLSGKVNH